MKHEMDLPVLINLTRLLAFCVCLERPQKLVKLCLCSMFLQVRYFIICPWSALVAVRHPSSCKHDATSVRTAEIECRTQQHIYRRSLTCCDLYTVVSVVTTTADQCFARDTLLCKVDKSASFCRCHLTVASAAERNTVGTTDHSLDHSWRHASHH